MDKIAERRYAACRLCPRDCGVDRIAGESGFCGETAALRIAAASIHYGEEPPVTGSGGSGTVFISGCNLGCTFCQNHQISQGGMGRPLAPDEFIRICLTLQEEGAENINIVTGSHTVPALVEGLSSAKAQGLAIPVLWNSSAYERGETLELLEPVIDGYLPDLKTLNPALSRRFFNAPDYGERARKAILSMMDRRPLSYKKNKEKVLQSGVIIRHLVLPGFLASTREVLQWFAEHARGRALLSLMTQYTPLNTPLAPQRFINEEEYETVLGWLNEFGIEDGFYQELTADSDWLPDFARTNPFSSDLSLPVWHWKG
jgi:putative pyruvate formate lyase activating enzyme